MSKLDTEGRGSGPAILELAREMDRTARKLDAGTPAVWSSGPRPSPVEKTAPWLSE